MEQEIVYAPSAFKHDIAEMDIDHTKFHDMSDEEYDALDELLTHTNPELTGIPGVFASQRTLLGLLDTVTRAEATHQTAAQVIGAMGLWGR
jgi:hypothetical protein